MKYVNEGMAISVGVKILGQDYKITAFCKCVDYDAEKYKIDFIISDLDSGITDSCCDESYRPVGITLSSSKSHYRMDVANEIDILAERGYFNFSAKRLMECIDRNNKYLDIVQMVV